tara:strand:+ start:2245 stop:2817 length:573 start_codon:yes stop_codon:yes gene_type:complete
MPKLCEVDGDIARPVPGYPDYRVYTDGSVYSLPRERKGVGYNSHLQGRFLKPVLVGSSKASLRYNAVPLRCDGKRKLCRLNRIVAKAFIPNPDNLPCVDHIDGNRRNDDVRNLRWVSHSTNSRNQHSVNSSSGYQGVHFVSGKPNFKWSASWTDDTKKGRLKLFRTKEEAIAHRAAMVAKYYDRSEGSTH